MTSDIIASWAPYRLDFKFEARTSRERMHCKHTCFVRLQQGNRTAYGECALFRGLSADDRPDYEERLAYYCSRLDELDKCGYSSIRFGLETALRNLSHDSAADWALMPEGIPINGLVWMGDKALMQQRIDAKLAEGFKVLKLKIGGINFADELDLLRLIRQRYSRRDLEIRIDANGSFSPQDAPDRLEALAEFGIHSIEQPIAAGQAESMAALCASSPIPIALDEELIGCSDAGFKHRLLSDIKPAYIILKPALCGGLSGAEQWIEAAGQCGIGYWLTSALESNIGLDAIGALAARHKVEIPQGLGTGELYHNNIPSPLRRCGSRLFFDDNAEWKIPQLNWITPAL